MENDPRMEHIKMEEIVTNDVDYDSTPTKRKIIIKLSEDIIQTMNLDLKNNNVDEFDSITDLIELEMVYQLGMIFPAWREKLKEKYPKQFGVIGVEPLWELSTERESE